MTGETGAPRRRRRWLIRLAGACAALAALAFLTGFSPLAALAARLTIAPDRIIAEQRPDPIYEQVVPRYAEICATSQWRKKIGGGGNPFGHAVIYLKGACRDEGAPFPQLRRCARAATSVDDPEHGAGVSVGRFFRNVNWVAIPGHALTFDGLLAPGERLTEARAAEATAVAIDAGVFRGVELHAPYSAATRADLEAYVGAHSLGTDFALRYARNVFCARTPLSEPALDEAIAFLNDKNREYAEGAADYAWSLFNHNCVHTVRNALAAANLWAPISVLQVKLLALFNLAVPANEFVNLALLGADGPLDDAADVAGDAAVRDGMHEWGWLPTRHGAVVKFLPAFADNDLFDPEFRLFAVQSLFSVGATQATVRMMSDPRHVDLEANLDHYLGRYRAALARAEAVDPLASVRGDPLRRLRRLHADTLRAAQADAEAMLAQVRALKAARP